VPVHQQLILAVTSTKSGSSATANIILLAGFVILIVFFMRSRKAARRRTETLRSNISVGQKVMTSSGIFATVVASDDESFSLEVADGVVMRFARAAVTKVLAQPLGEVDEMPQTPSVFADGYGFADDRPSEDPAKEDPAKSSSDS
jgi:preprotein translocase subunit YajC